jgi:dihydroneopterin aldolase/2-amino-4-hydroxy-6-hydroxymethyldihydropteridine diphosphokinase
MSDMIRITGIRATGFHGVYTQERERGQEFVVDVSMHTDTSPVVHTDDIAHTVDYAAVAADVVALVTGEPVNLIETLAERIARRVLARDFVTSVDVTVHKPQADLGVSVDDVSVTIHRERETHA